MCDLKWSRRHENMCKIEKVNEICEMNKKNNIIILPEYVKMTEAIDRYIG